MLDDPARQAQPDQLEPIADPQGTEPASPEDAPYASLGDDISALYEDGKTYLDAEIAFQKTRASYAGEKTKQGIVFGLGAFAFLHLALIGLVVGLIFALAPIVGGFVATAIVVGRLLLGMACFGWLAAKRFGAISDAFKSETDEQT